jgi:hypothetical protein
MKKSAAVRAMILKAKAQGLTPVDIVTEVMSELGFHRQLARAYINNNWSKVEAPVEQAQPAKGPSMTKDAVRKREARARARAARELAQAQAEGCLRDIPQPESAEV